MAWFWRKNSPSQSLAAPAKRAAPPPGEVSPTFCVAPFVQQLVLPYGALGYCCVAIHGGVLPSPTTENHHMFAVEHGFAAGWNCDSMRKIRQSMLAGKTVKDCANCYFQESIGKRSSRQMINEEWIGKVPDEVARRVEQARQCDGRLDEGPLYLDLRLGNLCSLRCRTCNPFNSSRIMTEAIEMAAEDAEFGAFNHKVHGWELEPIAPWFEDEGFWQSVEAQLPRLRKLYMTGGEPTLIKRNLSFLRKCVETGHAQHIFLMLSSNCMFFSDELLALLPEFEFCLINCSVDAVGVANDFIRDGSKWSTIDRNLRRLIVLGERVKIGVTPVVQIFNILCLSELLDYVEELNAQSINEINVDFLYANQPPHLDIRHLPEGLKMLASVRLNDFKARSRLYRSNSYLQSSVDSCLTALAAPKPKDAEHQLKIFMRLTAALDKKRGQNYAAVFPELAAYLQPSEFTASL